MKCSSFGRGGTVAGSVVLLIEHRTEHGFKVNGVVNPVFGLRRNCRPCHILVEVMGV